MRIVCLLIACVLLAGCLSSGVYTVPQSNVTWDCPNPFEDCTGSLSAVPTRTPSPLTSGHVRVGDTFAPYLAPDTYVNWTMVSAPGPYTLNVGHQEVFMVGTDLGDYVLYANWSYLGTTYEFTHTITIEP